MTQDARRSRSVRQAIAVSRLIASEPMTLAQLAERMGFDQRTARRYIYALRLAGVDVGRREDARTRSHRYYLDPKAWAGLLYLPPDDAGASRRAS